jgi:hypothetical protein
MTERLTDDELNKILSGNYDNETIVFLLGGEKDDRVLNRLLLLLRQQVIDKDAKDTTAGGGRGRIGSLDAKCNTV